MLFGCSAIAERMTTITAITYCSMPSVLYKLFPTLEPCSVDITNPILEIRNRLREVDSFALGYTGGKKMGFELRSA